MKIRPSLLLLFEIANIECVRFDNTDLAPVWGYMRPSEQKVLEKGIQRLDRFLTRETSLPQNELDVLHNINTGLEKSKKMTLEQLRSLAQVCSSVELRADGLLWGKFECLKTLGNQMERVLTEAGQPMHLREIAREINKRLVSHNKRKVTSGSLGRSSSNKVSSDGRFKNVGHSGQWGLVSWADVDTSSILK
ncbi:MAG: hypothetical protein H0U60_08420, partial [Blastocatellia bacterium]|nr:hypothetical protein [Blastocatellia bacterium]